MTVQFGSCSHLGVTVTPYRPNSNAILRKIWPALRTEIEKVLDFGSIPGNNDWSQNIRQWLMDNKVLLEKIDSLSFINLYLEEIPEEVQFFTCLKRLHLEGNRIFSFPEWMHKWPVKDQPLTIFAAGDCAQALQTSLFPKWQINIIDSP